MRRRDIFSILVLVMVIGLAGVQAFAQAQNAAPANAKQMKRDEVYFSLARKINSINESQVSAVVAELDGVIEVTDITLLADGKAEVTVKERAPSNAANTQKSIKLHFTPPPTGEQWTWVEFENNRRFYPVERLFPYVQNELNKRKQATVSGWNAYLGTMVKQGEAANKVLDTAKAIIKAEPQPMPIVTASRKAMADAMKENKTEETLNAYNDLSGQTEAITLLGDSYPDLKANDAYLRLLEEFKNSVNVTNAARKNYVQSVDVYNESLLRLPWALAAYGLQFTRMEPKVTAE
ncbi:MAG: LemA family protein [Blastocatellales bacterium]